jgi:hypothetical protein
MVHPDYRRRGVFTTLTEQSLSFYEERDPAFVFNQPNAKSQPGFERLGWRLLDRMVTYYRVQDPAAVLDVEGIPSVLGRTAASGYLGVRRFLRRQPDRGFSVNVHEGVAADQLAELYRRRTPDAIHAVRLGAHYRWRYGSPGWSRKTYIATDDRGPVAGLLVRKKETTDGVEVAQLADLAPTTGDDQWRAALAAAIGRALRSYRNADVVAAPGRAFPSDLLSSFGFRPDDRLPAAALTSHDRRLCVRPLTADGGWTLNGVDLSEPSNWLLSYGERDTS